MGRSTLLRFDLDKAIRSLGQEHAGQTPLDSVTGQIDTQNTPQGMVVSLQPAASPLGRIQRIGQGARCRPADSGRAGG